MRERDIRFVPIIRGPGAKQVKKIGGPLLRPAGEMAPFFTPEAKTGEPCGGEVRGVSTYLLRLAFHIVWGARRVQGIESTCRKKFKSALGQVYDLFLASIWTSEFWYIARTCS